MTTEVQVNTNLNTVSSIEIPTALVSDSNCIDDTNLIMDGFNTRSNPKLNNNPHSMNLVHSFAFNDKKINDADKSVYPISEGGEYSGSEEDAIDSSFLDEELSVPDNNIDRVSISILLTYNSQSTMIFSNHGEKGTFNDQNHLIKDPLVNFMEALQSHFNIENDISLFFPQLKLTFHQHMVFTEKLCLLDLSFLASQNIDDNNGSVLEIKLLEQENNFITQYNALLSSTGSLDSDDEEFDDVENNIVDDEDIEVNLSKRERPFHCESDQQLKKQKL